MVQISDLLKKLNKRDVNSHKGDFGRVLIIAGSNNMLGASILSSKASLRTGSGLVYLSINRKSYNAIHVSSIETICVSRRLNDLNRYDAILIGPGMGNNFNTYRILKKILSNYSGKLIIDADGINVISRYNLYENIRNYKNQIVFTPHLMEAKRLAKKDIEGEELVDYLIELTGKTILLKGHRTIVKNKSFKYINETGNPGMATAGSGDVLSGIILSLLGQGLDDFTASSIGAYIHGRTGDYVSSEIGEDGLIASDIIEKIPLVIKEIKE